MRGWILAALASASAILAGCGNPETDHLEPGTRAVVYDRDPDGAVADVTRPDGTGSFRKIPSGTPVVIGGDPPGEAGGEAYRKVQVRIELEGGLAATIRRGNLRPMR